VRQLLCRDIGAVGLEGDAVANFAEAQNCLQTRRYAIVIVDGSLANSDHFILELGQTAPATRIILTSNLGMVPHMDDTNGVTTLIKPIRRWRLINSLEKALNRKSTTTMIETMAQHSASPREMRRQALASLSHHHPLRILLAEDNPLNTKVALQHLKRMGYTADHAKDGLEVLALCEKAAANKSLYDVVLLDIQMPNMDGFEATRILRQRYGDDIRPTLVALTANATSSDKERSLGAGMDAHLSKPILPDSLADVLGSVTPKTLS